MSTVSTRGSYYKGYWMVTNRCNLNCSYCVLEDAPDQLRAELNLDAKKELVTHLYRNLGFRQLTLSGGEVLMIGRRLPSDFIELLRHIRQFRSDDADANLKTELYTNGTYLTDQVADEMAGVIDTVAVTIDSSRESFLAAIGRTNRRFNQYFQQIVEVCGRLTRRGIKLKLHSVVSRKNHKLLAAEVKAILAAVKAAGGNVYRWKFYQYMSYDSPTCDQAHQITAQEYETFCRYVQQELAGEDVELHLKDNAEMNASLFNILSYGNAQYMRDGDSWSNSARTRDLRTYESMEQLFTQHDIDEERFRKFHELVR